MVKSPEKLLEPCITIAKNAGNKILEFYKTDREIDIKVKHDATPVTKADLAAHDLIIAALKKLTPEIPILSEEDSTIDFSIRKKWTTYWLIDPLDGTKEFINQTDEFTVNIALIHQGHSILGVIYAPVYNDCYFACENKGAFKQHHQEKPEAISSRKITDQTIVATVSRRHNVSKALEFLSKVPNHKKIAKGSSLKTCVIAEGLADVYPCFGKTSEWDMGAAQCIIEAAGGAMMGLQGEPIRFNQKESLLNPPLLVVGDKDYNWGKYFNH